MKWGVRRYQNKDGTRTKAGRERYSKKNRGITAKNNAISPLGVVADILDAAGVDPRIKTAVLVTPVAIAAGVGVVRRITHKKPYKESLKNRITSFEQVKKIDGDHSKDSDMAAVNENYSRFNYHTNRNCAYCSIAYEMRRRGYDVKAGEAFHGTDMDGESMLNLAKCFTNPENPDKAVGLADIPSVHMSWITKRKSIDSLMTQLSDFGDGASGLLGISWENGGGHSVIWSNENGATVIRDCQRNVKETPEKILKHSLSVAYYRTDNLDINEEALKYVKNRED